MRSEKKGEGSEVERGKEGGEVELGLRKNREEKG